MNIQSKILVAGCRDFAHYDILENTLNMIISDLELSDIEIINGDADGADKLSTTYAEKYNYNVKKYPAQWQNFTGQHVKIAYKGDYKYNSLAGINRNVDMAEYVSKSIPNGYLVAFWDGKSTGTKHMIKTAQKYRLKIYIAIVINGALIKIYRIWPNN